MLKDYFLVALFSVVIIASLFALNGINPKIEYLNKIDCSILPPSASISGTTEVCLNSTTDPEVTFTGSGGNAPYTFTYTINGGGNLTISTTGLNNSVDIPVNTGTPGVFIYNLVSVENNTGDTEIASGAATITINELSTVDFTFDNNSACSDTPVNFTSSATGNGPFTYSWNFGDGETSSNNSPTHRFEATGCGNQTFNVTLTVTDDNGCTASVTKPITVQQKPILEFEDIDNPSDPFNNCGNNVTNASYTINVGIDNVSPCIASYTIDWGDGSPMETGVTFPATHTYTQRGAFNMEITGIGTNCDSSVTYLVKNSSAPTGSLVTPGNTVNLCTPATIQFAIGSWGTNPSDTNYTINYGDGTVESYTQGQLEASAFFNTTTPSNSQDFLISHTYTETSCPDSYNAVLTVATSCGQIELTEGPIVILRQPKANFEIPYINCPGSIIIENTSLVGYSNNCSIDDAYSFDYRSIGSVSGVVVRGRISFVDLRFIVMQVNIPGEYILELNARNSCIDPDGSPSSISKVICIQPPLVGTFILDTNNDCAPLDVRVTNTTDLSESCGGETYLWEVTYDNDFCGTDEAIWNFTNGTDENSVHPSLNFVTPGTYTLTQNVIYACGSTKSSQVIEVKQPPIATIDAIPNSCGSATINPTANVNPCAPESETLTYSWSFPGGTPATATTLNPGTINYTSPGNYEVAFSATNSCGTTTDTESFNINIIADSALSDFSLSADTTDALDCDDVNSGAINLTVTGGTPPLRYLWSNGAITEDLSNIPPGNYSVEVTDANNFCAISGDWTINRLDAIDVNVNTETDVNCDTKTLNQSFIAQVTGGNPPYSINWSRGTISGTNREIMNTSEDGPVTIDVTDNSGCSTSFLYTVEIPVLGDVDFSVSSMAFGAFGFYSIEDPIEFTNTSTGNYLSLSWDFGDGNSSTEENSIHSYSKEGTYSIIQTVTYPFGCVFTQQTTLDIGKGYTLIMPNAFTPNRDDINTYFAPKFIALNTVRFNVYDTWGGLIYSEEGDTIKGWNGRIKGAEAENGNYYYTITAKTFYGKTITQKGAFVSIK